MKPWKRSITQLQYDWGRFKVGKYIHAGNLTEYLDMALIKNKSSPTTGYALLKLHQIINEHPEYFGCITIDDCDGCRWNGRNQKCSRCRRNPSLKDCFEEGL